MIFKTAKFGSSAKKAWEFAKNSPIARTVAGHTIGGAAIGGYMGARAHNKKLLPSQKKGKKAISKGKAIAIGAGLGALGGAGTSVSNARLISDMGLDETAVKSFKSKMKEHGIKYHDVDRALATLGGGAIGAAYGYHAQRYANKKQKKKGGDPVNAALLMGGLGASFGHAAGSASRGYRLLKAQDRINAAGGFHAAAQATKIPDWLKGVKTKAEAKSAFKAQARKHHPDAGGSEEAFKRVASEWEGFEKGHFNKLSMVYYNAMAEELTKIGMDLQDAAFMLPGLVAGYRTGRAAAGHAAASTAPHGYKTRSEDIARRAGMVVAPAGAIGAMALAHKKDWGRKAADWVAKKAPRGVVMDPSQEHQIIRKGVVPAATALAGGTLAGYALGKGVGWYARAKDKKRQESAA